MSTEKKYSAECFCGAVQFSVSGDPVMMGYCHCESCRKWSAAPVSAFALWKPEAIHITHGTDHIGTSNRTKRSSRKWCKKCGGHILTEHPEMELVEVCAAIVPDMPFRPSVHVHYQESVLRIHDGLAKMKDVPKEAGGSGISLPE